MAEQVDVCIIGGGVVGLFCALEQAKRGKVVRLIDKLYAGSSRYNMGEIVLKGLPDHLSEFAEYSRVQWAQAAESFGANLGYEGMNCARFSLKGSSIGKLKGEYEREKALGFDVQFLQEEDKIKEVLGIDYIPEGVKGITFSDQEGAIDTEKALDGLRKMVIQAGVRIWGADQVETINSEGGEVKSITTDTGEQCMAKQYIFATGVWSGTLLAKVGEALPIRPARVHILQLIPNGTVPKCILNSGEPYGNILVKPQINGRVLVMYTASMDPAQATWSTQQDPEVIAWLRTRAGEMVRGLNNAQLRSVNVVTTAITPDKCPYIGAVENYYNLYIAAGMNGKSYAFAAGAAKYLARLMNGQETPISGETINAILPSSKRFK